MTDQLEKNSDQIENYEKFNLSYGEIFAKEIIDKLISYTVTETYKIEIDTKLNSYTFNYIQNTFHKLLEINYITRDRDDIDITKSLPVEDDLFIPQNKYYYNNLYFGMNEWTDILEPPKIDRGASTLIKIVKSTTLNIARDDVIPENLISKLEQSNVESTKNNTKIFTNKKMNSKQHKMTEAKVTFYDREIPNLPVEREDRMITLMREEKFKDIKKKLQEEEERIKQQLEKEREAMKLESFKPREVDGKKFTFDVNGSSIIMKDIDVEKLGLDFNLARYDIREKPTGGVPNVKNQIQPLHITNNNNTVNNNSKLERKLSFINNQEYDYLDKYNRKQVKIEAPTFTKTERAPIQPAGSNYDLIAPETGVTIIEGSKSKSGSTDYHQKFGKYSKYDYSIMLKQLGNKSLPNINLNNINNTSTFSNKDNSTIIINKSTINPIANYNDSIIDNTFTSVIENNLNSVNSSDFSRKLIRVNNINESLKISSRFTNGLKSAFDSLNIIPELGEKNAEVNTNENNISGIFLSEKVKYLSGPKSTRHKSESLDVINKFNLSIIKNPKWGAYDDEHVKLVKNAKQPRKLKNEELEKEVGKRILKVKLPRSRVYNLEKNKVEHFK